LSAAPPPARQRADRSIWGPGADADRGLIAGFPDRKLLHADGTVMFGLARLDYITDDAPAPDTVNPSLWRQSQVMRRGGLYKVTDGLYQARNNDIANLTIVEGDDGLVIIDCTASVEAARQGLGLFRAHVSDKPVVAVIYTHTHIDHYGGVKGVVDPADVASGKVPVIAPGTIASLDKYAIGENVVAGNAMSRRAGFAFGSLLDLNPRGMITCGIGVISTPGPTVSYISPTDAVTETGTRRELAGLEFEFLYAPDTEAPEEMHIWIPRLKALTCAENANHSLHNIQTLRGARTRDARNFARYLDETLERWGDAAEVHYGPHTWPVWGNANIVSFIESQRDTYKYIHDQALRLANKGYTPLEAAEVIELPAELGRKWFNRGYHGTLHHDVRAVYTKELGMWDGDPVSLHPHPSAESARRYVEFIGPDRILAEGKRAFDAADYRWAAEILHKLVFAQPDNQAARALQADAYEQMATRPRARSGAASTSPRHGNCARACSQPRSPPRAPTRSWRCRSTSCSTSLPSTSSATGPPRPTCGSASPSPTWMRSGPYGSGAGCSMRGAAPPPTRSSPSPDPRPRSSAWCCSPPPRASSPRPGRSSSTGTRRCWQPWPG
jgi:alkyl sulfatase BDS1-like metallo-beta-lactamase superfamily hydrolase